MTIQDIITNTLTKLNISYKGVFEEEVVEQRVFRIDTDDAKLLIGLRGETLRALEYIVRKLAEAQGFEHPHFIVDIDGYKSSHIKEIQQKALMMAERAKAFAYDVELSPMSAYERLIVHAALTNIPGITTESKGEGKERRVVIKYSSDHQNPPSPQPVI